MRDELKEYEAVEAAAMNFVKSVAEGDSSHAKKLFTGEAVLFGYLDGKLEHGSIEQFYHNVDTVAAGDDFKARVDVVLVEETLAVAHVLEEGRPKYGPMVLSRPVLLHGASIVAVHIFSAVLPPTASPTTRGLQKMQACKSSFKAATISQATATGKGAPPCTTCSSSSPSPSSAAAPSA